MSGTRTKRKIAAVFVALACATVCFGLDITTRNGTTYRKCEVVKVEPDGIRVTHDAGAAKIEFEDLPDALKRQYNFDPAKVAAYRKVIADAKAAAEAKAKMEGDRVEAARRKAAADARTEDERRLALEREQAAALEVARAEKTKRAAEEKTSQENREKIVGISLIIGGLFVYFIPSIIGARKSNGCAIFVLNLFLGWSLIGWVIALVWACTKEKTKG